MFNSLMLAVEASLHGSHNAAVAKLFKTCDLIFLSIYTVEFILKVYCEPKKYVCNSIHQHFGVYAAPIHCSQRADTDMVLTLVSDPAATGWTRTIDLTSPS